MLLVDEVLSVLDADLALVADHLGRRAVDADGFAPDVDHDHVPGAGDDRGQHCQGDVESGHEGAVEGVGEDVRAGVDLGDARVRAGDVPGAEPARRDDAGGEAAAVEGVDDADQHVVGSLAFSMRSARSGSSMQWPS